MDVRCVASEVRGYEFTAAWLTTGFPERRVQEAEAQELRQMKKLVEVELQGRLVEKREILGSEDVRAVASGLSRVMLGKARERAHRIRWSRQVWNTEKEEWVLE